MRSLHVAGPKLLPIPSLHWRIDARGVLHPLPLNDLEKTSTNNRTCVSASRRSTFCLDRHFTPPGKEGDAAGPEWLYNLWTNCGIRSRKAVTNSKKIS